MKHQYEININAKPLLVDKDDYNNPEKSIFVKVDIWGSKIHVHKLIEGFLSYEIHPERDKDKNMKFEKRFKISDRRENVSNFSFSGEKFIEKSSHVIKAITLIKPIFVEVEEHEEPDKTMSRLLYIAEDYLRLALKEYGGCDYLLED